MIYISQYEIFLLNIHITSASRCNPAYSWVGKGNLVLRYSVPHFPPNFSALCVEWQNSIPGYCLVASSKKLKYSIVIHSLEWASNPQPSRNSHILVLCHDELYWFLFDLYSSYICDVNEMSYNLFIKSCIFIIVTPCYI